MRHCRLRRRETGCSGPAHRYRTADLVAGRWFHHAGGGKLADRDEVALRVVRQLFIKRRIDRMRAAVADRPGMAVGRRPRDEVHRHDAVIAGAVVDDDDLPEHLGHLRRQQTDLRVAGAAGCRRRQRAHWTFRRALRRHQRRGNHGCQQQSAKLEWRLHLCRYRQEGCLLTQINAKAACIAQAVAKHLPLTGEQI